MASVSSVSSSSSSIYGNKNVISGLASGMDTESMIENAVSGYKTKISTLQQKRTKVEWQQEVYRSIISKMSSFSDKYTSYASSTNLLSSSFFNQAVKVTSAGKYADMVSASGKTDSSVQILGVKQLAKAATYTVSGIGDSKPADKSDSTVSKSEEKPSFTGSAVDLSEKKELSNVSGSLTIKYGSDRSYTIDFGELDIYESADKLADAIRSKLGEQTMTLSDGTSVKVGDKIVVKVNGDGNIEFSDNSGAGNTVSISNATGKIKDTLGIDTMGRKDLYEAFTDLYSFSPTFRGYGIGWVTRYISIMTEEGIGVFGTHNFGGMHNDLVTMYIELGFWGFAFWIWLSWQGKVVWCQKQYGTETAFLLLYCTVYAFVTYATDNTAFYCYMNTIFMLLPIGHAMKLLDQNEVIDNHAHSKKQPVEPPAEK